ncbi:MAG: hypothetical protein ACE5JX_21440 [Acidobacteriota bacterium]
MAQDEKKLSNRPIVESSWAQSEDGKWIIHRTVITDIKSTRYVEKELEPDE